MNVALSEDQELLLHTAREILERECPMSRVRKTMEDPDDPCSDLFETLARLGWTGLALPTPYDDSSHQFTHRVGGNTSPRRCGRRPKLVQYTTLGLLLRHA